jgi:hypothetical protein
LAQWNFVFISRVASGTVGVLKRLLPLHSESAFKKVIGGIVMVGGAVAHPAAIPEPDVTLSRHPAHQ